VTVGTHVHPLIEELSHIGIASQYERIQQAALSL
jgi:hypothetical protein